MNGVALALALSAFGVDYNVQTAEDGKREYVVQMEPELLKSLADGQQIHSAVPSDAGQIERILIRVGTTAPKHSQTHITEYRRLLVEAARIASTDGRGVADPTASVFWAAKDKPKLDFNVQYGWQPDTQGVLSYFVQINPVLLQQLAIGDEIRAGIDPAAGSIGKFVIQAGIEELPKIPVEPAAIARTDVGSGRPRFNPSASASAGDLYPGAGKSVYGPAPSTVKPIDRPAAPLASTPDYGPPPAHQPRAHQPVDAATEQPPLYAPIPRSGTRSGSGASDVGANLGPPNYAYQTQSGFGQGQPAYHDPRQIPPRGMMEPPPVQYAPPAYAAAGEPQHVAPQTGYPPAVNYAPATAPQDRVASVSRPATAANINTPLAAPQINPTSATKPPAESSSENKPYLTMIVTFALFVSIGANLYLGWTAGEYYSRYRLATERLRSASRA
jgi:hypothetical protein